ncbi:MAG: hypothetical protein IJ014_03850 [Rikenellaceae bacterium]|nr:hypothetical protein [Rikenellaceae bacterium]
MRVKGNIRMLWLVVAMVTTLGSCTVKEWTDEYVLRKAVVFFDYADSLESVRLQLRYNGSVYRDTVMTITTDPAEVTWLYNGRYKALSLISTDNCPMESADNGTIIISAPKSEGNTFGPVGVVLANEFWFDVVKGDRKEFAPQMQPLTRAMSLEVRGLEWVRGGESLTFEYDYAVAMTSEGNIWSPSGQVEYATYQPLTSYADGRMTGWWHTIFDNTARELPLRLIDNNGRVVYERIVTIEDDNRDNTINILIEFSRTHIHCTVEDWSEVVERVTVDIE